MQNPFKNPPKGSSFKPNTMKTLKHKYSKDLSKRTPPAGDEGFKAPKATRGKQGGSPRIAPNFESYNGGRR